MIRAALAALLLLAAFGAGAAERPAAYIENPNLVTEVARGALPPIEARLPENPLVLAPKEIGKYGGELRTLMASAKDTRLMVVYGYTRLMRWTPELELVPDILASVDNEDDRVFTLHLRKGHKWSDGQPFTSEDFRYWFEDIRLNAKLSPSGLPQALLVDGERPKFEVLSETAVRYSWSKPNRIFLQATAGPSPLYLYAPAHYLKRYHAKYADPAALEEMVKHAGQRNWAALHNKHDNQYRNDNPDLPTLEPWVLATRPPSERFIFNRNAYFHRVDTAGRQLPYIDRVAMSIADNKIIPLKTGSGESDLQARYLRFDNYTFLKEAEERNDYTVRLWRQATGAHLALFPNLNVADPVWRPLVRDVRFRRALSLAVNRHEINQAIYYGLAIPGQNTILPSSPLYNSDYREAWAGFDLKAANRLLDELGLTKRTNEGIRLLPDGRPMQIIVENSGESTEQSDVLELVRDTWRSAGIKLYSKPSQREVFRNRIFAGETLMSIDKGIENGLATPDMPPLEFAPTTQQQLMWPKWGQYIETRGKAGEPIELEGARELRQLLGEWFEAGTRSARAEVWNKMLKIWADDVYSIGLVAGVLQPVVVNNQLRNVPVEGIYNWEPGAHFGIYSPDTFWFASTATAQSPQQ
jgi:peptide/nickel transport system substrate-binding protein